MSKWVLQALIYLSNLIISYIRVGLPVMVWGEGSYLCWGTLIFSREVTGSLCEQISVFRQVGAFQPQLSHERL